MGCRQGKLECKKDEKTAADGPVDEAAEAGQGNEATVPDDSPKVIVVFGATGTLGGSVVKYIGQDEKFKVRAVSHDADGTEAKKLAEQGVDVVVADLNDKDSLKKVIEGAYGIFLLTFSDGSLDADKEIQQGKNAVDVAKECKVQHLIFSGAESVKDTINKECKPFESKATVEKYIDEQNVPSTVVRFATFYEDLINHEMMKPKANDAGEFVIDIPMGDEAFDMICAEDVGECIHQIFAKASEFIGKTIGLSSQRFKVEEYAAMLSKALENKKFVAGTTSLEDFAKSEVPGAQDWANVFELYRSGKCERDIELTRKLNPSISPFEQWIDNNREAIEVSLKS